MNIQIRTNCDGSFCETPTQCDKCGGHICPGIGRYNFTHKGDSLSRCVICQEKFGLTVNLDASMPHHERYAA